MRRDPWPWHVPADLVECDSEGRLLPDWPLRRWGAAGTLACLQHPCCCDCPHAGGALRLLFSPQQQTSPIKPIPGLLQWKIQLLGHQQDHSIRTEGPWTSSMFCLLSWDDTSRPWTLAGAGDSVLLSHRPSLQSSMLSSAVCTGCVTQVCCPGKAPAKCKLSQVNSSSKLLQGELCAKIKKKIQQDRQTLLKLYFSSFKAVSSFQLFPHTHSFSRTEYNRPDEMSKSNPCIRQGQQ